MTSRKDYAQDCIFLPLACHWSRDWSTDVLFISWQVTYSTTHTLCVFVFNQFGDQVQSLTIAQSKDVKIKWLTSLNSKGFHVSIYQSSGVTVQNMRISAPSNSPNTDGIHVQLSDHVIIRGANIQTGDDCISMGAGTNSVLIQDIHCGPGHGIR
jgi:polygalacturonase